MTLLPDSIERMRSSCSSFFWSDSRAFFAGEVRHCGTTRRFAFGVLFAAVLHALSGCATADLISPPAAEDDERDTRRDSEDVDGDDSRDTDAPLNDADADDVTIVNDVSGADALAPDSDSGDAPTPSTDVMADAGDGDVVLPDAVTDDTATADASGDAPLDAPLADTVTDVELDVPADVPPDGVDDIVEITDTGLSDVTPADVDDSDTESGPVTPTLPANVCGRDLGNTTINPVWGWDSGNEGWTPAGGWGRNTLARRSGTHGMDTNNGATYYSNNRSDRLSWTSAIAVTNCASCAVAVSFWLKGETETTYDGLTLQCSPDGGATWTNVSEFIDGYFGSWTRFQYPLPASCLTADMRLSFLFTTDSSVTYEGYFLDDVDVSTTPRRPEGYLDTVNVSGVTGWACDGDSWTTETFVRLVYFRNGGSESLERLVRAAEIRADVGTAGVCGGTSNHGYNLTHDTALLDWLGAGTHTVRAYALDAPDPCGAGWRELTQSPRTFTR